MALRSPDVICQTRTPLPQEPRCHSNEVLVCWIVDAGIKGIAVTGEVAFLSDMNQALSCRFSGPFSKSAVRASVDIFSKDRTTVVAVAE